MLTIWLVVVLTLTFLSGYRTGKELANETPLTADDVLRRMPLAANDN